MNEYQYELWDKLSHLEKTHESFHKRDFHFDGRFYRVFTYFLAGYAEFQLPGALEARGIMFETSNPGLKPLVAIDLVSLPFPKFFNLHENPMTMDMDLSKVSAVYDKMDGSMMSTFTHQGDLWLKSKKSPFSVHAASAMKYLRKCDNRQLRKELQALEEHGITTVLEWVSPRQPFRIVVGYPEDGLVVLGGRNCCTGEFYEFDDRTPEICRRLVRQIDVQGDMESFINAVDSDESGIEGYVLHFEDGQMVKIKTKWYRDRHHVKDDVKFSRRLFEAVLEERTDDIKSMFYDDESVLSRVEGMEDRVRTFLNDLRTTSERFYEEHKHLGSKEFADKTVAFGEPYRGMIFALRKGVEPAYVKFARQHARKFGVWSPDEDMGDE